MECILEGLMGEETTTDRGEGQCELVPKSKKFPPLNLCPNVDLFVKLVSEEFWEIPVAIPNDNLTS